MSQTEQPQTPETGRVEAGQVTVVPAAATPAASPATYPPAHRGERVPVRTIAATIGMVLATVLALLLVQRIERTLIWILIALFFAVAASPAVGFLERRLHLKRSLATLFVFLGAFLVLAGLLAMFITPLARQADDLAAAVPRWAADIRAGRGQVGELAHRFHIDRYLQDNQTVLRTGLRGLGAPAAHVLALIGAGIAATLSIFVLAFLMVLEGPRMLDAAFAQFGEERETRMRRVGVDCAKTVTGYITGNLLISVICGALTWIVLAATGVPFAGVIALFVAVADLVPLIGATLGAVVAVIAALIHSVPAAIIVAVWFVVYQQLENHLLQPVILSRTVKLNPLAVLISILLGAELLGILGTLLAIPVAGIIQVVLRDLYDVRRGRRRPVPTVGENEVPAT
jgi:predicted PurR-regulated permease PerM